MVIITPQTPKTDQPFPSGSETLWGHQLSTLHELREFENNGRIIVEPANPAFHAIRRLLYTAPHDIQKPINIFTQMGILSSPTGTGKTHPMVALAMQPYIGKSKKAVCEHSSVVRLEMECPMDPQRYLPATLIIVPKNIYGQWMRVIEISGAKYIGLFDHKTLEDFRAITGQCADNGDWSAFPAIVLCKHTLYQDLVRGGFARWSRVVLDEADTITIPNSATIEAGFIWLVTATAQHLHRTPHKGYWKGLISHLDTNMINCLEITIDQQYALDCLHGATAVHHRIRCKGIANMNHIGRYLPEKVQEMINAGDYATAFTELGGRSHTTESLSQIIVKYYQERIDNTQKLIQEQAGLEHKHDALDSRLKTLLERKAEILELLQKVSAECSICHDTTNDISMAQCCFQTFCTECMVEWMAMRANQSCAFCRAENPVIMRISESGKKAEKTEVIPETDLLSMEPQHTKFQTLPKLLAHIFQSNDLAKVIIVTSYNLQAFKAQLEHFQYVFNVLNHVSYRKTVREYNDGSSPIILLDAKFTGAGIDLEMTTHIIYMQELPENLMKQTLGRAIRLSRPVGLSLNVFHLDDEAGDPIDRFVGLGALIPKRMKMPVIRIRTESDSDEEPKPAKVVLPAPKRMIKIV